ncbi:hypothetical protein BHE74_00008456 [Ensete ventricosum]|nr:hypothetical protein GW17_00005122 [Ensete ventricosum]RWW83053.1 hypothetical protein BHE74_00008456 [Ensete ventricosum]RZR93484.1 hypothetical protein BHM03_00021999 [Ensete ventricosum]
MKLKGICSFDVELRLRYIDDKFAVNNIHGSISISEKHEKRTRKKDRPDRGVWAPRRRADRSRSGDGGPSAEVTQMTDALDSISISQQAVGKVGEEDMVVKNVRVGRGNNLHAAYEIGRVERKADMSSASRSEDMKMYGSGRVDFSSLDNGSHRHVGRRVSARGPKETDSSLSLTEGKSFKRGPTVYSSHERQVWVQKSGSAS